MYDLLADSIRNIVGKVFNDKDYLDAIKIEKIVKYVNFLQEENQKKNLVSRKTTEDEIVNRHILSSLLFVKHIAELAKKQDIKRICDIGSGSGFPAIICSICLPEIYFAVVDSIQKKIDFLYDTGVLVDLKNLECFWGRIEDFGFAGGFMETFDVVTARALGSMQETAELSFPLLKLNGIFLTIKSFGQKDEIERFEKNISKNGNEFWMIEEDIDESFMVFTKRLVENKEQEKYKNKKR
jgi:16S rRNA (guanine527-N7)-methyltransferase